MEKQTSPGYILTARTLLESRIWTMPLWYLKCFLWLLLTANHKDVERNGYLYKRGELITTYHEIITAMGYYHNKQRILPTLKQVRNILAWLASEGMIEVSPIRDFENDATLLPNMGRPPLRTRAYIGIKIVIVNYNTYQTPENYRGIHGRKDFSLLGHNNNNEQEKDNNALLVASFEKFYSAYPKHKDRERAFKAWKKLKPSDVLIEKIHLAIENQKVAGEAQQERGKFVPEWPYPATWINGHRWEDEIDEPKRGDDGWI